VFCLATSAAASSRGHSRILIDAASGEVLAERSADVAHPPGALANLMVVLLSLEQAALGTLPLQVPVVVSAAAARRPAADSVDADSRRVPLRTDHSYLLVDLLRATMVTSSEETALAVAEAVTGSVAECVGLMNARARRLGLSATSFVSPGDLNGSSGVTGRTTARDMARLARTLVRHPETLRWSSLAGMPFERGAVALRNVNELLAVVPGADGLHVSSTPEAGFSVVATAERHGLRLIAVILAAADSASRYRAAVDLIEWGFVHYERVDVVRKGEPLKVSLPVHGGSAPRVTPIAGADVSLLRRRGETQDLHIRYQLPAVLSAPVDPGGTIGELIVEQNERLVAVVPVLASGPGTADAFQAASLE
jgi:D-alanyl-D-alanine carboxypeptidase (penicillin-binding protein 5/6)